MVFHLHKTAIYMDYTHFHKMYIESEVSAVIHCAVLCSDLATATAVLAAKTTTTQCAGVSQSNKHLSPHLVLSPLTQPLINQPVIN